MSRKYDITALAYNKRGRLLAVGKNSYVRTHRLQAEYGKRSGKPNAIFLHAELAALLKARAKGELVHKLVVMRFDVDGNPKLSKPCPSCQLAIADWGVKIVEHT